MPNAMNAEFQRMHPGDTKLPALKEATSVFSSKFRTSPTKREPESHGSLKVKACFIDCSQENQRSGDLDSHGINHIIPVQ